MCLWPSWVCASFCHWPQFFFPRNIRGGISARLSFSADGFMFILFFLYSRAFLWGFLFCWILLLASRFARHSDCFILCGSAIIIAFVVVGRVFFPELPGAANVKDCRKWRQQPELYYFEIIIKYERWTAGGKNTARVARWVKPHLLGNSGNNWFSKCKMN